MRILHKNVLLDILVSIVMMLPILVLIFIVEFSESYKALFIFSISYISAISLFFIVSGIRKIIKPYSLKLLNLSKEKMVFYKDVDAMLITTVFVVETIAILSCTTTKSPFYILLIILMYIVQFFTMPLALNEKNTVDLRNSLLVEKYGIDDALDYIKVLDSNEEDLTDELLTEESNKSDRFGIFYNKATLCRKLGISPIALKKLVKDGVILKNVNSDNKAVYPAMQFKNHKINPDFVECFEKFAGQGGWQMMYWFTTPFAEFEGRTPFQILQSGSDAEKAFLNVLAEEEAAIFRGFLNYGEAPLNLKDIFNSDDKHDE